MPDLLLSTLSKVVLPALGIGALLFAAKRRKMSLTEDIGFKVPKLVPALAFLLLWVVLIAVEELLSSAIGGASPKPWPDYALHIVLLRVLAIGVLGPIAEEIAFRGLLMSWLKGTRLAVYGAILVSSALWSVVHIQYAPILMLLIFVDGVVLGAARHFSRSIYVPVAMHIAGNLFSIWQSL
ncbi:MAG: hypothetical protein CFE43_15715 [Burkholderiales bacterium PBB3]|nr:MAG: hypothetical protein CFE43_15715 [Burkholderiales bacterium PBB3]